MAEDWEEKMLEQMAEMFKDGYDRRYQSIKGHDETVPI